MHLLGGSAEVLEKHDGQRSIHFMIPFQLGDLSSSQSFKSPLLNLNKTRQDEGRVHIWKSPELHNRNIPLRSHVETSDSQQSARASLQKPGDS